jgi:hypothetical protein
VGFGLVNSFASKTTLLFFAIAGVALNSANLNSHKDRVMKLGTVKFFV